ncbi:lipopolysaccharide assembly protein LapA domain-containing protein [Trujillonella humicola]|uniref:lipopolysaccharide assembly protein LapA domain-containing protein n=1 Tax=Trujillonella humicola TaxID=3383699 RepID=UPI00390678BC
MAQQVPGSPGTTGTDGAAGRAGLSGGLVATIAGGGLLLLFMLQNRDDVTVSFLGWRFSWPLWLFTIVTAVLGAILWIGLGVLRRHRRRVARRAARG